MAETSLSFLDNGGDYRLVSSEVDDLPIFEFIENFWTYLNDKSFFRIVNFLFLADKYHLHDDYYVFLFEHLQESIIRETPPIEPLVIDKQQLATRFFEFFGADMLMKCAAYFRLSFAIDLYETTMLFTLTTSFINFLAETCSIKNLTLTENSRVSSLVKLSEHLESLNISSTTYNTNLIIGCKLIKLFAKNAPNLQHIPLSMRDTLTTLDLSGSTDVKAILEFEYLETLILRGNGLIHTLPKSMDRLVKLDVGDTAIAESEVNRAPNLVHLIAKNNPHITKITNSLHTLRILDASGENCGIGDCGMALITNLEILDCFNNTRITDISRFAASTRQLRCGGKSALRNIGTRVVLESLISENHTYTFDCVFGALLNSLKIVGNGVNDYNLRVSRKLKILHLSNNTTITSLAFSQTLEILHIGKNVSMSSDSLIYLTKLKKLHIDKTFAITTMPIMSEDLETLVLDGSLISNSTLNKFKFLRNLCVKNCPCITTVVPFAKTLETLDISGTCGVTDLGLAHDMSLKLIIAKNNPGITSLSRFRKTLLAADISGICGVSGIAELSALETLHFGGNSNFSLFQYDLSKLENYILDLPLTDCACKVMKDIFSGEKFHSACVIAAIFAEYEMCHIDTDEWTNWKILRHMRQFYQELLRRMYFCSKNKSDENCFTTGFHLKELSIDIYKNNSLVIRFPQFEQK